MQRAKVITRIAFKATPEGFSSFDVEYYLSTSSTSLAGGSWQTTPPTWVEGRYMWTRTKVGKTDGTTTYTFPVCIGGTGRGIHSIQEQYYLSTSSSTQTGGSWANSPQTWVDGKYMWTRSVITYTDGSTTTTDPVCVAGWRGERGALPRISRWVANFRYLAGNAGEAFVDYVYYNGTYYRCLETHTSVDGQTPYSLVNAGSNRWALETDYKFMASTCVIVGEDGVGWILDRGKIYHTSGAIGFNADGSFFAANNKTTISASGILETIEAIIRNSKLTDVVVYGTIRQPFVRYSGGWDWDGDEDLSEAQLHDNLLMHGGGYIGTIGADGFPWDASQNGRRITIMTYRYNGALSGGGVSFTAPNGKYFFQDGEKYGTLKLYSREFVELIGIGEDDTFYGWLVTKRGNIETNKAYGRQLNVLASGSVTGQTNHGYCSMNYKTFDGRTLSCQRNSQGKYTVYFPEAWGLSSEDYIVMLTGYGYVLENNNNDSPVKATLTSKTSSYFGVDISDDDTRNDGSFLFTIINIKDFTYNENLQ